MEEVGLHIPQKGLAEAPMVSVIVTTYQHGNYIEKCIHGILEQDYPGTVEILLGEDGSGDGTREKCQALASKYPDRIRLFLRRREDVLFIGGRPTGRANFMSLLSEAKGKYVAICEGDDHWNDPLKISKQVDFLERSPEYVITYHDCCIIGPDGRIVADSKVPPPFRRDHSPEELMRNETFITTLSILMRNVAVLKELPPEFTKVLNGDNFLTSMLGRYGAGKYMDTVAPACYRVHGGGMWSAVSEERKQLDQLNTWMWLAAYYDRIGRSDVAEHFISRVNSKLAVYSEWYLLGRRRVYRMFARFMSWFGVTLPR